MICPFCERRFIAQYDKQVFCGPKHKIYQNNLNWLMGLKARLVQESRKDEAPAKDQGGGGGSNDEAGSNGLGGGEGGGADEGGI